MLYTVLPSYSIQHMIDGLAYSMACLPDESIICLYAAILDNN